MFRAISCALICVSISGRVEGRAAQTSPVRLTVAETAGVARTNEIVTSGVPFPRGMLKSASNVRLVDEKGAEVPLQLAVTGAWPDKSIKWLLLDFPCSVGPGKTRHFKLAYGAGVRRKPPTAAQNAAANEFVPGAPETREIVVEVDGKPLEQSTVASGTKQSREIVHNYIGRILRKERIDWVDWVTSSFATLFALTARTSAPVGSARQVTSYHLRQVSDQAALHVTKWEIPLLTDAEIKSVTFGGGTRAFPIKPKDEYELAQESAAAYTVRRNGKRVASGAGAPGWLTVDLGESSQTFAVRDFRQQFPLALVVKPDGVTLRAWAAREPLKYERGIGKTLEVLAVEGPPRKSGATAASSFQSPLFAVAPAQWYRSSGAFGSLIPVDDAGILSFEPDLDVALTRLTQGRAVGWKEWGSAPPGSADYDPVDLFAVHFARTGARKWLNALSASARFQSDLGANHVTGQPIATGPEGRTTPSDLGGTYVRGLIAYSYLTGDTRGLETAKEIASWVSRQVRRGAENERAAGLALDALCAVYEATGDNKLLDAAKEFVATLVEEQDPSGKLGVKRPTDDAGYHGLAISGLARYHELAPSDAMLKSIELLADRARALPPDDSGRTLEGFRWLFDRTRHGRFKVASIKTWAAVTDGVKSRGWAPAAAYYAGRYVHKVQSPRTKPAARP